MVIFIVSFGYHVYVSLSYRHTRQFRLTERTARFGMSGTSFSHVHFLTHSNRNTRSSNLTPIHPSTRTHGHADTTCLKLITTLPSSLPLAHSLCTYAFCRFSFLFSSFSFAPPPPPETPHASFLAPHPFCSNTYTSHPPVRQYERHKRCGRGVWASTDFALQKRCRLKHCRVSTWVGKRLVWGREGT